jgi:hypothetical protein
MLEKTVKGDNQEWAIQRHRQHWAQDTIRRQQITQHRKLR